MTTKEKGGVDWNRQPPEIPHHIHAADCTAPPENGKPAKPSQSTQDRFSGRAPCADIQPAETEKKSPAIFAVWAIAGKLGPRTTAWRVSDIRALISA